MKKRDVTSLALILSFSLFASTSHAAEESITVTNEDWKIVQEILNEEDFPKEESEEVINYDELENDIVEDEKIEEVELPISSKEVENLTQEIIKGDEDIMSVSPDGYFEGYEVLNHNMSYEFAGYPVNIKAYRVSFRQGEAPDQQLSQSIVVGLRDVAKALFGSKASFSFGDISNSKINLISGIDYVGPYNSSYSDMELQNADVKEFNGELVIDGNPVAAMGFIINGEYYFRASIIAKALDLRFFSDFKDSSKAYLSDEKSDIKVPTEKEIMEEIDKAEYTIIFNRAPWCPYSRAALPEMEEFNSMLEKRNLDIQILGFINDSKNYTWEDLEELFINGKSPWVNFGANEEIYAFLEKLSGRKVTGFPNRYIIDKDGKVYGKEFFDYYDEIVEKMDIDPDEMTEEEDDEIQDYIYKNFLKLTLGEKLLKEAVKKPEDKPLPIKDKDKDVAKVDKVVKSIPQPMKDTPLKKGEMVEANPKTGIASIIPMALTTMVASIGAYKFTKKK